MLCNDDGLYVPRSTVQRIPDINLSETIRKYERKYGHHPFHTLTDVDWEQVYFDLTIVEDILEKRKEEGRNSEMSPIDCDIFGSLTYVRYQRMEEQRERSKAAREFLENLLKQRRQTRISVLSAHGNMIDGQWKYFDYGRPVEAVQEWIDRESESRTKPNVLIIASCNPGGVIPHARQIPVLYPIGDVGYFKDHAYYLARQRQ